MLRILIRLGAALIVAGSAVTTAAVADAAGHARTSTNRPATRCALALIGRGIAPARAVPGSADAQVLAPFAALRRPRTAVDAFPRASDLRRVLTIQHAVTYDPSAVMRVQREGRRGGVYAIPATISTSPTIAACATAGSTADRAGYAASLGLSAGEGPGICLVDMQWVATPSQLPGHRAAPARPTVEGATCASTATLTGYVGAWGEAGSGLPVLVPDGVSAVTYTWPDGRSATVAAADNLIQPPAGPQANAAAPTFGAYAAHLRADLPTTIVETGADGATVATLTPPPTLLGDGLAAARFIRQVVSRAKVFSVAASSFGSIDAACRASTHRCVAVIVHVVCHRDRCKLGRTIARYRYVGAHPPRGTTGNEPAPLTGPILARVNRVVHHPRRMTLVLSGTPHLAVRLLETVTCFGSGDAVTGSGSPVTTVAVPSRTPLHVPAGRRSACEVGVLVVGAPRGRVHARLDVMTSR